jgi:hypothetical protein
MIFNSLGVKIISEKFPWAQKNFLVKTTYVHRYNTLASKSIQDVKFNQQYKPEEIKRRIGDNPFFSTGPQGVTEIMIEVLEEMYPKKSRYEK